MGSTDSQGDAAIWTDFARAEFPIDGTGVTVGTLSDSYNCLGGEAADVASGDLPAAVTVVSDPTHAGCIDEGRAIWRLSVEGGEKR